METKMRRVLSTFFKSTGLEAIYFDLDLKSFSGDFSELLYEDFSALSMGGIESFLTGIFMQNSFADEGFYTYCLNNNLISNIVILHSSESMLGAFVTQPVALRSHSRGEIAEAMKNIITDPQKMDAYRQALMRAPVIAYDRIMPMGEVLNSLVHTGLVSEIQTRQIMCGGTADPSINDLIQSGTPASRNHKLLASEKHSAHSVFLRINECIAKGDTDALSKAMDDISAGSIPMDQLDPDSFVRSLKNSFIKACAMCSFTAIDAGASYTKTMDLSDEFVRKMEQLDNINDIYDLMRSALLAFTRAVAVTRITAHSKPVRLTIEYIERHYNEKITLAMLSGIANISSSYLSNLIKKETGQSLAENINRVRIEESKRILLQSNVNISELASMVGFTYGNYFARTFKHFTGMTPSEFKSSLSMEPETDINSVNILKLLSDQLQHTALIFPELFDACRIVDADSNQAWVQETAGKLSQSTCYDFWTRKESCSTCISRMALEKKQQMMKLEQRGDSTFLVVASPVLVGSKRYVLEMLKHVSDNFIDCTADLVMAKKEKSKLLRSSPGK